jgi:hypothetical protein
VGTENINDEDESVACLNYVALWLVSVPLVRWHDKHDATSDGDADQSAVPPRDDLLHADLEASW